VLSITLWFGVFCWISPDVLDWISQSFHRIKALYVPMMDLYFISQFVKGRCHGNQIMLPKWRQTDTTCILCTFARWEQGFILLLLATNATISCKTLVKIGPVVGGEHSNRNCVACSRRGSAYVIQYLWMYWTDFRNHFTIWKRFTCRWWICTSFSNLSRALPWQPNNFAIMKINWYYVHSLQFGR